MKITDHFSQQEFTCKCGCGEVLIDMQLVYGLEVLRRLLRKPIIINSAYRCEAHNKAVGGVDNSQHRLGTAADIRVSGMTPSEIHKLACNIFDGVGLYDNFVHVDVRGVKARWGKLPDITDKDVLPEGPTEQEILDKLGEVE